MAYVDVTTTLRNGAHHVLIRAYDACNTTMHLVHRLHADPVLRGCRGSGALTARRPCPQRSSGPLAAAASSPSHRPLYPQHEHDTEASPPRALVTSQPSSQNFSDPYPHAMHVAGRLPVPCELPLDTHRAHDVLTFAASPSRTLKPATTRTRLCVLPTAGGASRAASLTRARAWRSGVSMRTALGLRGADEFQLRSGSSSHPLGMVSCAIVIVEPQYRMRVESWMPQYPRAPSALPLSASKRNLQRAATRGSTEKLLTATALAFFVYSLLSAIFRQQSLLPIY
ncbi:hypothetical protein B0H16DRAFT_1884806 [Mycena metata]|uniref:Uncharacterized protein n=1 Tax=Mycena metata TaxID=1033252 RepID=A0AAD7J931_9AGAR|nr:hypothetical protein B0H16DRAFT_1884806 [Mycena metata]